MRFFRRNRAARLPEIGEGEAYDHSYGSQSGDVKIVKLEPRRPRYRRVLGNGERLREAFIERLERREEVSATSESAEEEPPEQ